MAMSFPMMGASISIHALREEGDALLTESLELSRNFYPRPPRGGRPNRWFIGYRYTRFLSTPSARRATTQVIGTCLGMIFLSTPSARRATCPAALPQHHLPISIHALREEGDMLSRVSWQCQENFYPRPPRGGRPCGAGATLLAFLFLSTPSARRATAKTETKSLFSNKLYNILHEFRRALIYNGSKNYPNHAK